MKNLTAALIKAQTDMQPLHKDAKGNYGKYATLAAAQDAALPALAKHGIAVMQSVSTEYGERVLVKVGCTLFHTESGEFVVNEIALQPEKPTPQAIGSAITYGRRYLLCAMAGLAPEDDDGESASHGAQRQQVAAPQRRQQAAVPPSPPSNHHDDDLPPSFASVDEALNWGVEQGCFKHPNHARNAYNELKLKKAPKSSGEMWSYWIAEVMGRKGQAGAGDMSQ